MKYKGKNFFIEKIKASTLAKKYHTPLYCYSYDKLKKNINNLSLEELKKIIPKLTKDVLKVFDLKNSINSKKSYGGTSFDNIKKMIMKYKKQI